MACPPRLETAGSDRATIFELNVDSYRRRTALAHKRPTNARGQPATRATPNTSKAVEPPDS